jgi:hypothetical protein
MEGELMDNHLPLSLSSPGKVTFLEGKGRLLASNLTPLPRRDKVGGRGAGRRLRISGTTNPL